MKFEEKKPWNGEQKHEKPYQEKSEYPKNKETAPKGQEKHEKWGSESKKGCGCK